MPVAVICVGAVASDMLETVPKKRTLEHTHREAIDSTTTPF
jgi:hypothetical protein